MRDIHFSFARGVWCFVFGGVCGGFWHTPHSVMMAMMKIGKDMTLPRLDVFCGGLVITNKCTKLCSELKLDTKLFPRVCFEAYVQGARLRAIFLSSLSSRAKGDDDENN
tara:strand:- start:23 stop:349 length:327 start_codon:yes stop_codon:yes gene_type:complete